MFPTTNPALHAMPPSAASSHLTAEVTGLSTDYSHHYSTDYSKQWPPKSQSTNNVQIPGQKLLPLDPPPLSRNQSSSFLFLYVFTKCLFSVSQSASVLNTFFRQILPITLPVGFIIFKTRFRAVMQPLRPCGGAKIQRQVFLAPQSYSFHCIRQFPAAIPPSADIAGDASYFQHCSKSSPGLTLPTSQKDSLS